MGASWQINPEADLELGYDDNARFTAEDAESSWVSVARGAFRAARSTEVTDIGVAAEVNSTRYGGVSDLNNSGGSVALDAVYSGERNRIRLETAIDTQSTLTSEVATSGLNQINNQQYRFAINPSWGYLISERAAIDLDFNYQDVWYQDVGLTPLYNYTAWAAAAGGSYRLTERTTIRGRLDYGHYQAEQVENKYDNIGAEFGATYLFSEKLTGGLLLGLRHSESSSASADGIIEDDTSSGPTFAFYISSRFDNGGGVSLNAGRNLAPTGSGGVLDMTALSLNLDYPITERWLLSFDISGNKNREPSGEESRSVSSFAGTSLGVGYVLHPDWTLSASYRYRWQETADTPEAAQANAVFLTLAWSPQQEP